MPPSSLPGPWEQPIIRCSIARGETSLPHVSRFSLVMYTENWGRQNTQSLQAVLAVAPLKKGKHWEMCEILSVCLSSTICVYRTAKWFKPFVRGTFETEKLRKLRGVRAFSTTTKTVIKIMLILTPHAGFVLTLSNVRPSSLSYQGPLGAAPSSGVDRNRSMLSNVASP